MDRKSQTQEPESTRRIRERIARRRAEFANLSRRTTEARAEIAVLTDAPAERIAELADTAQGGR